jgi:hypothetical protein
MVSLRPIVQVMIKNLKKMKKSTSMHPDNFATATGLILMAVPSLFWLGIFLAVFFEKPIIMEHIMIPVDRVSSLLTLMIMVGLPIITILVNLKAMIQLKYSAQRDNIVTDIQFKGTFIQIALLMYASISILVVLYYAFFENFRFYSDQNIY